MSTGPIIDFHAHILPHADHGSVSMEETVGQLEIIRKAGVESVVALPHFYPNRHEVTSFLEKIDASVQKILEQNIQSPRIYLGAEVLYYDSLQNMEGLDSLCIRGTKVLMLELPMEPWKQELLFTVEQLMHRYTVVLVHIDRYILYNYDMIEQLLEMGAYAQINAESLFSRKLKKLLTPFLESDRVVALGSDLHNLDKKAYKKFADAPHKLKETYFVIMERAAVLLEQAQSL